MTTPRADDQAATAAPTDFLAPVEVVTVGAATIVVDALRPVAAVVTDDEVRWVTWPGAPRPAGDLEEARVLATPEGAWVVHSSADGDARPHRTAVHLTPAGVTATADLGTGWPIGADSAGLWVGDPRDASEWMGTFADDHDEEVGEAADEDADGQEEAGDETVDAVDLDPSTLPWMPETAFWPDPAGWTEPAEPYEHEDEHEHEHGFALEPGEAPDADAGPDPDRAADAGWSISFGHPDDVPDLADAPDASSDSQPGPPTPTPPTDVLLVGTAGERHTIRVDHLVDQVRRDGDAIVLRYHPQGPRQEAPAFGGGWDVVYEPREVRVDVSHGVPERVDTDELVSQPAAGDREDDWDAEAERHEEALAPWRDRLDLAGVDGAQWPLAALDRAARDEAEAALRTQFESLAEPNVVWTRDHPEPRRGRSSYRAVAVDTDGTWPATELVVTFEHTEVPFLRLRRRYRVFDDAGYPASWLYVTVHLDEDIATRQIPARSEAVDGVLDI